MATTKRHVKLWAGLFILAGVLTLASAVLRAETAAPAAGQTEPERESAEAQPMRWDIYDPSRRGNLQPVPDDEMVPVMVDGERFLLTPQEYHEIQLRRRAILRGMYEEHEMSALEELMRAESEEEQYRDRLREEFPFTPEQIISMRRQKLAVTKAQNVPVVEDIESNLRTINLDIDAAAPLELFVSRGFVSALVFYDQSGNPWPIEGDVIGDESAFGSQKVGEHSHIAVFEIKRSFAQSNALIYLKGLKIPLSIRLRGQEGKVDARLSVRVPRFGPGSEGGPVRVSREVASAPAEMMDLLNAGRVQDAREYSLEGVDGKVFYKEGALYLRTRAHLVVPPIAPPMSHEIVSPTGFNVYKIPAVSQLMFTVEGELKRARVEEKQAVSLQAGSTIFTQE